MNEQTMWWLSPAADWANALVSLGTLAVAVVALRISRKSFSSYVEDSEVRRRPVVAATAVWDGRCVSVIVENQSGSPIYNLNLEKTGGTKEFNFSSARFRKNTPRKPLKTGESFEILVEPALRDEELQRAVELFHQEAKELRISYSYGFDESGVAAVIANTDDARLAETHIGHGDGWKLTRNGELELERKYQDVKDSSTGEPIIFEARAHDNPEYIEKFLASNVSKIQVVEGSQYDDDHRYDGYIVRLFGWSQEPFSHEFRIFNGYNGREKADFFAVQLDRIFRGVGTRIV